MLCCNNHAYLIYEKTKSVYCEKTDLYFVETEKIRDIIPQRHLPDYRLESIEDESSKAYKYFSYLISVWSLRNLQDIFSNSFCALEADCICNTSPLPMLSYAFGHWKWTVYTILVRFQCTKNIRMFFGSLPPIDKSNNKESHKLWHTFTLHR